MLNHLAPRPTGAVLGSRALPAPAATRLTEGVLLRKLMPPNAVSLVGVDPGRADSSAKVLLAGYRLQVLRVYAMTNPAKVVQVETFTNLAHQRHIGDAVCVIPAISVAGTTELSITASALAGGPFPAPLTRLLDLSPEAGREFPGLLHDHLMTVARVAPSAGLRPRSLTPC